MVKEITKFLLQYYELLFRSEPRLRLVNWVSFARIIAFPFLVLLASYGQWQIFKWLLAVVFFTDMLDGFLARKLKATSDLGAKLDSIGDDLTILAGLIAMIIHFPDFILQQIGFILLMIFLFILETTISVVKYGKPSSLHTYMAKIAALFQGTFFILIFFFDEPITWLFYATTLVTSIELIEELIIVSILPKWSTNVRGLFWVLKNRQKHEKPTSD